MIFSHVLYQLSYPATGYAPAGTVCFHRGRRRRSRILAPPPLQFKSPSLLHHTAIMPQSRCDGATTLEP